MSLIYKIAYLNDLCSLFFALNFEFTSLLGDGKAWDCDSTKRIKSPKMIWKDSFILFEVPRVNGKRSAKGFGLLYLPLTWKAFLYCHSVVSRVFLTFFYKLNFFREMISESCIYQKSTTFRLKSRHFPCEFMKIRG